MTRKGIAEARSVSVVVAVVLAAFCSARVAAQEKESNPYEGDPRVAIHRDVVYGSDDANQQILDAYIIKSDKPTPVLVRVHAGWSFSRHSKNTYYSKRVNLFTKIKEAGISLVSITHRDFKTYGYPAPMTDTARAVQFVRSKAAEWNIDANHIAAIGGSGGGHCATWVALHDEMAKPRSADPVARMSTRLQCVVPMWTPTDFSRFGPPAKGEKYNLVAMVARVSGFEPNEYNVSPTGKRKVAELSLTTYVSKDDPPVMLVYEGTAEMIRDDHPPAPKVVNDPHHGWHGVILADRLKAAGVEHIKFMGPNAAGGPDRRDSEIVKFLVKHLKPARSAPTGRTQ